MVFNIKRRLVRLPPIVHYRQFSVYFATVAYRKTPFLSGPVRLAMGKFFAGCAVYPAEVVRERLAVFVAYVFQRVPDLTRYTSLISGLREGRLYGVFDACKAVGADDEDVFPRFPSSFSMDSQRPIKRGWPACLLAGSASRFHSRLCRRQRRLCVRRRICRERYAQPSCGRRLHLSLHSGWRLACPA